ncbi:MAG: hypothetical protein HFF90_07790 [Oscillibacter sp.]|nr:hypothetical protein [Oscillibacter sp.]
MKMDLKVLCKQLAQAKEEEVVSTEMCNPYLMEKVLRPLMRNETVLLKDIDFSQFDSEDIREIADYCESLEMEGQKLMQMVGAVANLEPAACKVRRFC